MGRVKKIDYYVADFETTVYKGQIATEVWAAAIVQMHTEDVQIFHSISDFFDYIFSFKKNMIIYFHNLKFDGEFILFYLLNNLKYGQAFDKHDNDWVKTNKMKNNTFKYSISLLGQWYSITVKKYDKIIEFRDSLKLLPFSVKEIGKSFGTIHKKLDMEYEGFRFAGCKITDNEKKYIANDVLVVKEAVEIMFSDGHDKLTIGSCCLEEFKKTYDTITYNNFFPDLTTFELDQSIHFYKNADKWIRKSYHGGWCYLKKGCENHVYKYGITLDYNSMYPSQMHSKSENWYPIGSPYFWTGEIPQQAKENNHYYFVRFRCSFEIKKGHLPTVQIKDNPLYKPTEWLETSDIFNPNTGEYDRFYLKDNKWCKAVVEMTMTCTDYILFLEHYNVYDLQILDGCWFYTAKGLFDEYINKYKKIKMESKGAKRTESKLFLNNLYGKMASSTDSSFKKAYLNEENIIKYDYIHAENKKAGYIAIGAAITSYARNEIIRTAQKNYKYFIYSDTDSMHLCIDISKINGVRLHETDFNAWACETEWDSAIFVRQKTYIERIVIKDGEKLENPYYSITCAGMPQKCKDLLSFSLAGKKPEEKEFLKLSEDEKNFLETKRKLTDFKTGLKVPGKLLPKRIQGGIVLSDTEFTLH